jgi:hypothetical protein
LLARVSNSRRPLLISARARRKILIRGNGVPKGCCGI